MKHLGVDYHFIRERVQGGKLRVTTVHRGQLADILIKALSQPRFQMLISKIGLSHWSSILRGHVKNIKEAPT